MLERGFVEDASERFHTIASDEVVAQIQVAQLAQIALQITSQDKQAKLRLSDIDFDRAHRQEAIEQSNADHCRTVKALGPALQQTRR